MLAAADPTSSIYLWCLVLIALVIAGFFLVSWVKKKVRQPDEPASVGFSLADLRQLLKSGQITPQEFERARDRLMASAKQEKPSKPA